MKTPKPNPAPQTVKILIVDDHPAVREGLSIKIAWEPGLEVCGEADDVPEALKLIATNKPDIVIVDISLKTGDGLDLIKRVRLQNKSVRMLVWSMYPESLYAERALRAGAQGYINKEQATDRIIEAIRRILAGKTYLSEPMTEKILKNANMDHHETIPGVPVEKLSDRELEAFQLFGQGLNTHEVARKMHVATKTVGTYRARIKLKLGLENIQQLIRTAANWVTK
jgi:DNA-binding NarL/FixJ family response regulator